MSLSPELEARSWKQTALAFLDFDPQLPSFSLAPGSGLRAKLIIFHFISLRDFLRSYKQPRSLNRHFVHVQDGVSLDHNGIFRILIIIVVIQPVRTQ